jgi:hypothetical protein
MPETKLVLIHWYGNRPEAELAKGALAAAGIESISQADTVGGMRDHIAWSGRGFDVFVREEDAEAARAALNPPDDAALAQDLGSGDDPPAES